MRKVYFIKPVGFNGPIKIGCSFAPGNRREQLQQWCPFPLEIVAEIDGDINLERRFHAHFESFHKGHEWFEATADLLVIIADISAGSFNPDILPRPKYLTVAGRTRAGKKWPDEQRERVRKNNALRRIEKATGLVLDSKDFSDRLEEFVANPCRETGGITRQEREALFRHRASQRHAEISKEYLASAIALSGSSSSETDEVAA